MLQHGSLLVKNENEINTDKNRYISTVYFHTLYIISKNKKYQLSKDGDEVGLQDYLKDIFKSYYAEFLLNFEISNLLEAFSE